MERIAIPSGARLVRARHLRPRRPFRRHARSRPLELASLGSLFCHRSRSRARLSERPFRPHLRAAQFSRFYSRIEDDGSNMRLFLSSLITNIILTISLAGWILFIPAGSTIAFAFMFPAIWLTSAVAGPLIATSDSGPSNFIVLVLASTIMNVAIYAAVFFGPFRVWSCVRRRRSALP